MLPFLMLESGRLLRIGAGGGGFFLKFRDNVHDCQCGKGK